MTTPVSTDPDRWKDLMFRQHAATFCDVLSARSVSIDWGQLINADTPRRQRRFATLDLGCGNGRLLPQLSAVSSLVVGIDYSPELLDRAARHISDLPNVALICGDFRSLSSYFPPAHFDAIVRAYTSLGYFDYDVELNVLKQCLAISKTSGVILVDTFNASWFKEFGNIRRVSKHDGFELIETYDWNATRNQVLCEWTYEFAAGEPISIDFTLDGYEESRVRALLDDAGWTIEAILAGYNRSLVEISNPASERLVVIARKVS